MKFPILRALMIGNALEYYDFFLYSFFVSILSPLFFPATDPLNALMMGFGVFAVGFISRPVGAIFFGHWGDKYGRKRALLGTLLLMAFSTIGIGLLPVYEKIGLFSPLFLVIFRLCQGFAAGGEVNGSAIFGLELTPLGKRGFVGALINSSAGVGAILATLMGALFTNGFMPEWAWRVPFFFGGFVAVIGLYLRHVLEESETHQRGKIPLLDMVQNYPLPFLKAIGVGGFIHVPFYIIVGYMNPTLHAKGVITSVELMLMNMAVTLMGVLVMPVLGHYSDKVGQQRLMTWGALGQIGLIVPVFLIYGTGNLLWILSAQMMLLMFAEAYVAPSNAYLNSLFPAECRYSGVAFGSCLGVALFGGTTPLMCGHFATLFGSLGPTFYLIGMALIGFMAVRQIKERFPSPSMRSS
ncbi:MAG: MFS transporter [Alphaproteobacteria bacterium]|nr:MFS transporter [Alphaproteobacteria bacterium]